MSDDRPQILKLTWPFVFGLIAIEATSLLLVAGLVWFFMNHDLFAKNESTEVRQVLMDQAAAWNRKDLEGFMAGYWNDERMSFATDDKITLGWQATLDRYRKRYQGEGKAMGELTFSDIDVSPYEKEWATARGRWRVDFPDNKSSSGLFILIFRKINGAWRIVHDHTTADAS